MEINEYLQKLKNILHLNDWVVEIIESEACETDARNYMVYNDWKCTITINKNLDIEYKKQSLVHELLHLINRDSYDIATDNIDGEFAKKMYTRYHERAIERQAIIIYALIQQPQAPVM